MPAVKKQRIWGLSIAAAAAIAIVMFMIFRYNLTDSQETIEYVKEEMKSSLSEKSIGIEKTVEGENLLIAEKVSGLEKASELKVIEMIGDVSGKVEIEGKGDVVGKKEIEAKGEVLGQGEVSKIEGAVEKEGVSKIDEADKNMEIKDQLFAMSTQNIVQKQSKWQTNISMTNMPSGASETYIGYRTFALGEIVNEQYNIMSKYLEPEAYTSVEHSWPITVGLTFKYNINERWSVGSGLTYSLHKSKLRSESNNYYYDDRQTLHYIGVPITIFYSIWQNDKISTYISGGGQAEKNISGRLHSNFYMDNQLELKDSRKISIKELQWSVNSSVGVEYKISNVVGLYAEPGVSYYFKNNTDLETIYKDQPFIFNLRLGLRLSFN